MADQTAEIEWRDGTIPVSTRYDDPYFSLSGGLEESRHVFLAGNDLPAAFSPGFHIAELGFGTGLNMLVAWQAWNQSGQPGALRFTSFEHILMAGDDIERALAAFPELAHLSQQFLAKWTGQNSRFDLPGLALNIIIGDARDTVPIWPNTANAWFLDGFSPAKNPELWTGPLLQQVAAHTVHNGTFATYTAAGQVRRTLDDAGFSVSRTAGFARKRHMLTGRKINAR